LFLSIAILYNEAATHWLSRFISM